jgi:AraC-like DNA-binding protein
LDEIFSTERLHIRDRFDYWHSVVCKTVVHHDGTPANRARFAGKINAGSLSNVGIFLFENSPMRFSHDRRHIENAASDDIFLCRQITGRLALRQAHRDVTLAPGDVALLDPMLPYDGSFLSDAKLLVFKTPRRDLESRLGRLNDALVLGIRPKPGIAKLASSFLGQLPEQTSRLEASAELVIKTQALDLIAMSLSSDCRFLSPTTSRRSYALARVRSVIEAKFAEPLTARDIAAAAGVSVRYANALLAQQVTYMFRFILSLRLERCRRAFDDRRQDHRSLSEIAYGWGFSDMTHFSRSFKKTFGVLPSEYRRLRETG